MSPTTAAWIAQHFYWQWKYSMDEKFLRERCYPYLSEVERYTAEMLNKEKDKNNKAKLLLSSSPEYNDNSIKAWFDGFTNYDLALIKSFYDFGTEVATTAYDRKPSEWLGVEMTLPELDVNETGLTVAPGHNLDASHRHMSPYMAIYPLCLLDIDNDTEKSIVEKSLKQIEAKGTSQWCGYSFSWMACIYARARQAEKAVKQLQIFASNFCSPNSFHLNGDQKGGQYSSFTYRPFTLEGNFAFAQGVHELLLQTRNGVIELFPAVPDSWKNVSFKTLRAPGAFLVSAERENGVPSQVTITAEQGGKLRIKKKPFRTFYITNLQKKYTLENGIMEIEMKKGETITIKNGYE
jgi:alpha-L-fucosidase 2